MLRHYISYQPVIAIHIMRSKNNGLTHTAVFKQLRFYLPKLYPMAAYLHLMIRSANILKLALIPESGQVSRFE
jgi:hypothetical protein